MYYMPNPKIEDVLREVDQENRPDSFTHKLSQTLNHLSFPRILDYSFPPGISEAGITQVGQVSYIGDGVCHIVGLDNAKVDEIVSIKTGSGYEKTLVLGIQDGRIEAVVLGDYANIKRGDSANLTHQQLQTPVGPELVGRVVSPLGEPIDGLGPIKTEQHRNVEFPAPGVIDRVPITKPLISGILSIDTTIPVGKGQRELVIGDRKTGKSRTVLDYISNQKDKQVQCVYVGVGIQAAKAKSALELLTERGAMSYTTMVLALSDDPPSIQYIAPYVGAAIGEYFMYEGQDALVVYDDLSKQAKAYRQVSLLLKRSPGRDAYPGDIFFLHSRLLERAGKLSPKLGSGSLTALPVAETQIGDVSDYIITNLMSITDGHIYLDANMMHEGIMPAINSSASVSRIGGKVQSKILQKVGELAGHILARYEEVKSFETINTEVTPETLRDIKRGKRIREIFSQESSTNFAITEQILMLGIAVSARMDHLELDQVDLFKTHFLDFIRQLDHDRLEAKIDRANRLEDVNPLFDKLFNAFTKKYALPSIPNQSGDQASN
jgi:F-type H+-transporting ATPase subunit alpha